MDCAARPAAGVDLIDERGASTRRGTPVLPWISPMSPPLVMNEFSSFIQALRGEIEAGLSAPSSGGQQLNRTPEHKRQLLCDLQSRCREPLTVDPCVYSSHEPVHAARSFRYSGLWAEKKGSGWI